MEPQPLSLTAEIAAWCTRQDQSLGEDAQAEDAIRSKLQSLAVSTLGTLGIAGAEDRSSLAVSTACRLWECILYHWQRLGGDSPLPWNNLIERLRSTRDSDSMEADLLTDVTLAHALQLGNSRAAEMFENKYLPLVRATAFRLGGERAVDVVQNFAAELVLPRQDRPPRIARYQGRTALASWLRVVVIHFCTSHFRRQSAEPLTVEPAEDKGLPAEQQADFAPCQDLVRTLICESAGELAAEDRLLIKWLLLDEVPQHQVAASLGIHTGNITRRRQRIASQIWNGVLQAARKRGKERSAHDCLDLILADGDHSLKQELGTVLARAISLESSSQGAC